MTFARVRLASLVLVAMVGLAGCGGGGGASGESESAAAETESAAAETESASAETETEAAGGGAATVSFAEPTDGATVSSPVHVRMEASGLTIERAGEVREGAGHFHVMVDTACIPPGQPIPNDPTHLHFGMAQTETDIELAPGQHTLCLQAGDGAHTALDATEEIAITVQ
jgi:hypothetical protein